MPTAIHLTSATASIASRLCGVAARFAAAVLRRHLARRTRRALNDLTDELLTDVGLTRGDIDFVAAALAQGCGCRQAGGGIVPRLTAYGFPFAATSGSVASRCSAQERTAAVRLRRAG